MSSEKKKTLLLLVMSKIETVHSGVRNVVAQDGGNFLINHYISTNFKKFGLLPLSVLFVLSSSLQLLCLLPLSDTCKYLLIFHSQCFVMTAL